MKRNHVFYLVFTAVMLMLLAVGATAAAQADTFDTYFELKGEIPETLYAGEHATSFSLYLYPKEGSGATISDDSVSISLIEGYASCYPYSFNHDDNNVYYCDLWIDDTTIGLLTIKLDVDWNGNTYTKEISFNVEAEPEDLPEIALVLPDGKAYYEVDVSSGFGNPQIALTGGTPELRAALEAEANVRIAPELNSGAGGFVQRGSVYYMAENGLYPFMLYCKYINLEISKPFVLAVKDGNGDYGVAGYDRWFSGFISTGLQLYYSPELGKPYLYGSITCAQAAPDYVRNSASYAILPAEGNENDCADWTIEDWYQPGTKGIYIDCKPGGAPGTGEYTLRVSWQGENGQTQSHEESFDVTMVAPPDNLPTELTAEDIIVEPEDYDPNDEYPLSVSWTPEGSSFPEGTELCLYTYSDAGRQDGDATYDYLNEILEGSPVYWCGGQGIKYMRFVASWENLEWIADFDINISMSENDISLLPYYLNMPYVDIIYIDSDAGEDTETSVAKLIGSRDPDYPITNFEVVHISGANGGMECRNEDNSDDEYYYNEAFCTFHEAGETMLEARVTCNNKVYTRRFSVKVLELPDNAPTGFELDKYTITAKAGEEMRLPRVTSYLPEGSELPDEDTYETDFWIDAEYETDMPSDEFESFRFWINKPGYYTGGMSILMGRTIRIEREFSMIITDEEGNLPLPELRYNPAETSIPVSSTDSMVAYIQGDVLLLPEYDVDISIKKNKCTGICSDIYVEKSRDSYPSTRFDARIHCLFPSKTGHMSYTATCKLVNRTTGDIIDTWVFPIEFDIVKDEEERPQDWRLVGRKDYSTAGSTLHIDYLRLVGTDVPPLSSITNEVYFDNNFNMNGGSWSYTNGKNARSGIDLVLDPSKPDVYYFTIEYLANGEFLASAQIRVTVGEIDPEIEIYSQFHKLVLQSQSDYYDTFYSFGYVATESDECEWTLSPKEGSGSLNLRLFRNYTEHTKEGEPLYAEGADNICFLIGNAVFEPGTYSYTLSVVASSESGKTLHGSFDFDILVMEKSPDFTPVVTLDEAERYIEAKVGEMILLPQPTVTWPENIPQYTEMYEQWTTYKYDCIRTTHMLHDARYIIVDKPGQYALRYEATIGNATGYVDVTLLVKDSTGIVPADDFSLTVKNPEGGSTLDAVLEVAPDEWQLIGYVTLNGYAPKQGESFELRVVEPAANEGVDVNISMTTNTAASLYAICSEPQEPMIWKLQVVRNNSIITEVPFVLFVGEPGISVVMYTHELVAEIGNKTKPDYYAYPVGTKVIWSSSSTDIVAIGKDGIPYAVAPGIATVRLSAVADPDIYDECTVVVLPAAKDTLLLPSGLSEIGESGFANGSFIGVVDGGALKTIGSKAFTQCGSLKILVLGNLLTAIADDAFEGCGDLIFVCADDSYAAQYAEGKENIICVYNNR